MIIIDWISNNFALFLTTITIVTVALNIALHWNIAKGDLRVVYPISMVVYLGYIVVETSLAFRHPEQISILLYNITNIWALSMAIKGYLRLRAAKPTS
jgi:hypothetical protein